MGLSTLQQKFADLFIELGNATDAYKKAGYKVKSDAVAKANASRLLTNANVKIYVENRMKELEKDSIAKQDEVLQFLTAVLRNEVREQIPLGIGEGHQALEEKDMSAKDRIKAAELLGKRYALFTENHNVDVTAQVVFVEDLPDDE
jgi:phage terminase small subunit